MNILIVSDFYSPGNSRVLEEYSGGLAERGHTVGLLAGSSDVDDDGDHLTTRNVHPQLFDYHPEEDPFSRFIKMMKQGYQQYRAYCNSVGEPGVILFNQPLSATPVLCAAPDTVQTYYVHHAPWAEEWEVHNPPAERSISRLARKPYRWLSKSLRHIDERFVLSRSDQVIVLSQYMKRKVLNNHPSTVSSVNIIPGGVDPDQFSPDGTMTSRKRLGWDSKTVIFTLRRLVYRMGIDRLIDTFEVLLQTVNNPEQLLLVIGGTGPARSSLEARAETVAPDQIQFEGYVGEQDLPDYYGGADLFVLPTRRLEGFGLVTLEALASGTPVVATRVGGTEEILSQLDEDLFLPEYSPGEWSATLQSIMNSHRLSNDYGTRCRKFVEDNYTWDRALDKVARLINGT